VLVEEKEKEMFFPEHQSLKINQRMIVEYGGTETLAELLALKVFGECRTQIVDGCYVLVIRDAIRMTIVEPRKTACLEFVSSPRNDIMADEFGFLLSQVTNDPEWDPFSGDIENDRIQSVLQVVMGEYPESIQKDHLITVRQANHEIARIDLRTNEVTSEDLSLQLRFEAVLDAVTL